MKYPTAARRLMLWKAALGFAGVIAASLALTATAGAAVYYPTSGNASTTSGSNSLYADIVAANTAGGSNTIVLTENGGVAADYPLAAAVTVTNGSLTITGTHNSQTTTLSPSIAIDGSQEASNTPSTDLITVDGTGSLTLEGLDLDGDSSPSNSAITVSGSTASLTAWGVDINTPGDIGIHATGGATVNFNDSTIDGAGLASIKESASTVKVLNSTIVNSDGEGINNTAGTVSLINSLDYYNTDSACDTSSGVTGDQTLTDDTSCGTTGFITSDASALDNTYVPSYGGNGGPELTIELASGNPGVLQGDPAYCPVNDGRFFPNPLSGSGPQHMCDIGAVTRSAQRQISGPSCVAQTPVYTVNSATQSVNVSDALSGLGPESGATYDPAASLSAATYSSSFFTNYNTSTSTTEVPSDTINNLEITNGGVSFVPTTAPSTTTQSIEATKTTSGIKTYWGFILTNWAGDSTVCN
jgi:hypothetical protein